MASNSEASTPSSTQKATSHLSRRVPFILRDVAFFRCEGLGWESMEIFLRCELWVAVGAALVEDLEKAHGSRRRLLQKM